MDAIFERFSATELDNVLHAISKYEHGDGYTAEEIQTYIWLHDKIAPPIDDAIKAITSYNEALIATAKAGKTLKRYKPGTYLDHFLNSGGFKGLLDKQIATENKNTQERNIAHQANLATIDAAASAKRSANASEISAGAAERSANAADRSAHLAKQALMVSIVAALLSLTALIKSFLG